jgi:hypothetical protein
MVMATSSAFGLVTTKGGGVARGTHGVATAKILQLHGRLENGKCQKRALLAPGSMNFEINNNFARIRRDIHFL